VQQKELGDVLPLAMLRAGTDVTAGLPSDLSDHPSAALLTTAHFFSEPVFDAILASRPDPGLCDEQGRTMFHLLCHTGNWFAARKWLSLGGSHEEPDVRGHLPLHTAAERGFAQVCSGLIQCGSDPNALNRENESPLLLAASSGHSETCMALLNLGADPFFVHKGHTIRETAEKKGHEDLADQLKAWEAALHASRSVEAAMANTKSTKPTKRTKAPG
jgi:ankyrin repeat protein